MTDAYDRAVARIEKFLNGVSLAMDAGEHWVTVNAGSASGGKGGGSHVMLDGEGRVKAGMGGRYKGVKVDKIPRKKFMNEKAYQRKQAAEHKSMDYTLPDKVDSNLIIQNRDRTGVGSQVQIQSIAAHPDYDRLSSSRTLADGAPVVAYGSIPKDQLGRIETVTDAKGQKVNVQYAVMEASDVAASHDMHGAPNDKFYSTDPNQTRAIAGNGRIAGLQRAYEQGTAGDYKNGLIDDETHGIPVDKIAGMQNPVLVRVMQPKDVTADIGDRSNTAGGLSMTAVEQAKTDMRRIDMANTDTYSDGNPTIDSVRAFVNRLPVSERGTLIDTDGYPTRQAQERMKAAMFAAAYDNDHLNRLASQAANPESARIMQGLQRSAGDVASIAQSNPKIRELIGNSAERVILASRNGKVTDAENTGSDMFKSSADNDTEDQIVRIFTRSKSSQEIHQKVSAVARALKVEADKENDTEFSMFASAPKKSDADVVKATLASFERSAA